jgi:hypothetical protein
MVKEDIMTPKGRIELEELKGRIKLLYFLVYQYEWLQAKRELLEVLERL